MSFIYLISLIVFCATACIVAALFFALRHFHENRELMAKIKGERPPERLEDIRPEEIPGTTSLTGRLKKYLSFSLRLIGNYSKPKKEEDLEHIEKLLARTGHRKHTAAITYFGAKAALALLFPVCFLAYIALIDYRAGLLPAVLVIILLALIGLFIPDAWLRIKQRKRKEQILKGFPDVLDLLVICVESGMGLDAALSRVGAEMQLNNREISEEIKLLLLELQAGISRRNALKNFAARIDLEEVGNFASLLIQTDTYGTSVAQALRVHSDSMRVKRHQRAEEMAVKLPVKLMIPLILCIFPILFLVILGPLAIQILRLF